MRACKEEIDVCKKEVEEYKKEVRVYEGLLEGEREGILVVMSVAVCVTSCVACEKMYVENLCAL